MRLIHKVAAVGVLLWTTGCLYTSDNVDSSVLMDAPRCGCDREPEQNLSDAGPRWEPIRGGTIHVRIHREPTGLLSLVDPDPLVVSLIDHSVLESLVRVSPEGEGIDPELATGYEWDEKTHTYTFHLDPKARWHDGEKLTSDDVSFVFGRLMDPDKVSIFSGELSNISQLTTPDKSTVVFRLDKPQPAFLYTLAAIPILPAHVYGRTPLTLHPASRAPVGSGPFRFFRWIPSKEIELARNQAWRGEAPFVDRIRYHIVKDDRVALDLFARGDLDIVTALDVHSRPRVEDGRWIDFIGPVYRAWLYNTKRSVFKQRQVRQAMGKLIDRGAIGCSILDCRAQLIDHPWSLDALKLGRFSSQEAARSFDPQGAERLLEEDGWRDKDGDGVRERRGIRLSFSLLLSAPDRDVRRTAVVVQEDLKRAGIEMQIITVNRSSYERKLKEGRFDAAVVSLEIKPKFSGWSLFHSDAIGGGENFGSFSDPGVDALIDELQLTQLEERRKELIKALTSKLRILQPMSYTFVPQRSYLVRDGIAGIRMRNGWFEQSSIRWVRKEP